MDAKDHDCSELLTWNNHDRPADEHDMEKAIAFAQSLRKGLAEALDTEQVAALLASADCDDEEGKYVARRKVFD